MAPFAAVSRNAMPELEAWQWLAGASCAFAIGVAKSGVPGVAIWAVPVMVLTVGDARLAAGWLLPILCVGDVFAVSFWRRHADLGQLLRLLPWVVAGMAGGAVALLLEEQVLRKIVGTIIFAMLALHVRLRTRPEVGAGVVHPSPYGVTAGFATTVANAAGPAMNLYLLGMRLPKQAFLGTAAVFYLVINLTKIPIYYWHGLFSRESLAFDLVLAPAAAAGSFAGRWAVERIPQRFFDAVVLTFTAVATALLFR